MIGAASVVAIVWSSNGEAFVGSGTGTGKKFPSGAVSNPSVPTGFLNDDDTFFTCSSWSRMRSLVNVFR